MALLSASGAISEVRVSKDKVVDTGTIAAGYQNFLICIEMFVAAELLERVFHVRISFAIVRIEVQKRGRSGRDGPGR